MIRPLRLLALATILVGTSGCFQLVIGGAALGAAGGAMASRDIRVRPGAPVRVELEQPRSFVADLRAGERRDTVHLRDTRVLVGRVERTAGDSAWIAVTEARGAPGIARFPRGGEPVVLVRQEPGARIAPLAHRPSYIVAGGLIGTGVGMVSAIAICIRTRCLD